jgi:hypothetical protein
MTRSRLAPSRRVAFHDLPVPAHRPNPTYTLAPREVCNDNQLLTTLLRDRFGMFLDSAPVRCYLVQMPRSVEPTESERDGESPRITVTLPKSDYEEVCRLARSKRVSNAWVIRDAVEKYIAADSPLFSQYTSAS